MGRSLRDRETVAGDKSFFRSGSHSKLLSGGKRCGGRVSEILRLRMPVM